MRTGAPPEAFKIVPLDPTPVEVHASPTPGEVFHANPALLALSSGRLLAALHLHGPGMKKMPGAKGRQYPHNHLLLGKIYSSNDKGASWQFRADLPFAFARLFRDGETVYALGHKGNLTIAKSHDGGNTWSKPEALTGEDEAGGLFAQGPGNVWTHNGHIHAAFMKTRPVTLTGWPGSILCPVVLRARQGANLLSAKAWSFSETDRTFAEWFGRDEWPGLGIPYFATPSGTRADPIGGGRFAPRIGWDDAHVLGVPDPAHDWHDPTGNSLLLVCRAGLHRAQFAAVLRIRLQDDAPPALEPIAAPSRVPLALLPWPGGNRKFDVFYDEPSRLYWLASNRIADSLVRPARLPPRRWGLPADEAGALQLHFSRNLADWSFAGLLHLPAEPGLFRTGCAMAARGPDLHVVFRAGGEDCRRLPQTPQILACRVPDFRELAY